MSAALMGFDRIPDTTGARLSCLPYAVFQLPSPRLSPELRRRCLTTFSSRGFCLVLEPKPRCELLLRSLAHNSIGIWPIEPAGLLEVLDRFVLLVSSKPPHLWVSPMPAGDVSVPAQHIQDDVNSYRSLTSRVQSRTQRPASAVRPAS
jgi:hypothetical protein